MTDLETARLALACLDLTELGETCTDQAVAALCEKARDARGPVAAVCVWPQFVGRAADALRGSSVAVATVVNFPAGGEDVGRVCDDVQEALGDGASEIDLVLPHAALARGAPEVATQMVAGVRDLVDRGRRLKVILETGVLADPARIAAASRLAIDAGADFIKTSTGKIAPGATPQAARTMLEAIRTSGRPVGLKPSGGIRTLADAALYIDLAESIMGTGWVTPRTFRIGASGLYDVLVATLGGQGGTSAQGAY